MGIADALGVVVVFTFLAAVALVCYGAWSAIADSRRVAREIEAYHRELRERNRCGCQRTKGEGL